MPTIEFGTRAAANRFRDRASEHLAPSDDRRSTTVKLKRSTPRRLRERAEEQSFVSQREQRGSAGMEELSDAEIQSLDRQHRTFRWQQHGFEAMRAKAALTRAGVTDWQDHWEPGEGVEGALKELRRSKEMSARTGAKTSVEGRHTDEEELSGGKRRRSRTESVVEERMDAAKQAGIVEADAEAAAFIREEEDFGGDPFDISFAATDEWGRPVPKGRDADRVRERHQDRSETAQAVDAVKAAPKTRDPLEWAENPNELDFPGVDTLDPELVHESRSEVAQEVDESLAAPEAPSVEAWAEEPDEWDLEGVDKPTEMDDFEAAERELLDGL